MTRASCNWSWVAVGLLAVLGVGVGVRWAGAQERGGKRGPAGPDPVNLAQQTEALCRDVEAASAELKELAATSQDAKLKAVAAKYADLGDRAAASRVLWAQMLKNLDEARRGSNEAAAIGALRTISTGQLLFREGDKDGDGNLQYASSLEVLGRSRLIDGYLAAGKRLGYVFTILGGDEFTWSARAVPEVPGKTGDRAFFVDESGVIRCTTDGSEANAKSQPIGG